MDRAEIVSILRIIRTGHFGQAREAIEAAIAELEPQPVTEAGLREAGAIEDGCGNLCIVLETWRHPYLCWADGEFHLMNSGPSIPLHITDMQHLHAFIAALRGRVVVK